MPSSPLLSPHLGAGAPLPQGRRLLEQLFTGATAALVLVGLAAGLALPPDAALRFTGLAATAAALAYSAAPLSTIWDVIRTRYGAPFSRSQRFASSSHRR